MSTVWLPTYAGLLRRLVRKELSEILRDRRTILTLILMPLLLYPLLAVAFRTFLLGNMVPSGPPVYAIGVPLERDGQGIISYLQEGQQILAQRQEVEARHANQVQGDPASPQTQPPELQYWQLEDLERAVRE